MNYPSMLTACTKLTVPEAAAKWIAKFPLALAMSVTLGKFSTIHDTIASSPGDMFQSVQPLNMYLTDVGLLEYFAVWLTNLVVLLD